MAEHDPTTGCDIAIAGGGPVGAALALALADGERRIAVVEARQAPPSGDTRATALSEGSVRLLDALGVWSALAPDAVPIHTVEVSQQGHYGRTRMRAATLGVTALGRVVAFDALARALAEAAARAPGIEWLAPATVADVTQDEERVNLQIDAAGGAMTRAARLTVAADGTRSPLRTALGIGTREHDYGQTALLATLETAGDPHTGYERFGVDGPMALLPAGGRRRTLVWTQSPEAAAATAELDQDAFAAAVAARLGRSMAPVVACTHPACWPLKRVEAEQDVQGRVALVGNAVRTLHPVGAQGFNLALRDVCGLAEALADVDDPGDAGDPGDPGDAAVLERWSRARRADRWRTRAFTDVLARGFVRGGRTFGAVRAGALLGLDTFEPARNGLATQTMGLLGGLPRVGQWRLRARS